MTINDQLNSFAGKTIENWASGDAIENPGETAYRISIDYDDGVDGTTWTDVFAEFLETDGAENVEALVVGGWGDMMEEGASTDIADALVAAAEKLKKLKAIFFAEVTFEECEISWIIQTDVSAILAAYPQLTDFAVRGGSSLSLGTLHHANLESLRVETGGLDQLVVRQVGQSKLPKLKHLELWLGADGYGATYELADLAPIIEGSIFPSLEYLGLRNSEMQDDIAELVSKSKILDRIKVLDLSMGVITDKGATALLASPGVKKLKKLDVSHNYCSEDILEKLFELGIEVDASENEDVDEEDRFVAVGE